MNKRILVIEDDPIATRLIEYTLKQRGYKVSAARNGIEGLKKAQDEEYGLIVLNVMLPGMDGFQVCHRLRAEAKTAQLPILILSGRTQKADIATGLKMGANDYLTKPAAPSKILSRVENLLAEKLINDSRIVSLIGSEEKVGTTSTVYDFATALSQMGKRVIAVDSCPYEGSVSEKFGVGAQDGITKLLDTSIDALNHYSVESDLVIHQTGIGILRIFEPSIKPQNILQSNFDFIFNRLREISDFVLVDLPFHSNAITRTVLAKSDLTVIVSNCTLDAAIGVKSVVNILSFMGLSLERVVAVLTDSKGAFLAEQLENIKPFIEANIGIKLLGIIPHEAKVSTELSPESQQAGLSASGSSIACLVKDLAQHMMAYGIAKSDSSRTEAKTK